MKLNRLCFLALLLLIPALAEAQGLFIRTDCTTITSPVTGQSWCLDATNNQLKFWNGSVWSANTAAAPTGTGYVKAAALAFSSVQAVPIPIADGGTGLTVGTSGGVLGYTATNTLASSALLPLNGVLLGGGAGATPTATAAPTNGQVLVGSTSAVPVLATLTASRDVVVTNGAGTITLDTRRVGAGRLTFSSATLIQFCPYNGNQFYIPSTAKAYVIPSACTTAANTSVTVDGTGASNLAASTTYLVCLFDSSGTLTVDFKTSVTHSADATTGIETCNATTRVLIGMVRTNSSSQFEDDNGLRGVLSFYNRRGIGLVNGFTAGRATASATYVELNSEIRGNFLTWADEAVTVFISGGVISGTAGTQTSTAIGFDGTTAEDAMMITFIQIISYTIGVSTGMVKNGLAEGVHYATCLGLTTGLVTTTWSGGAVGAQRTSLSVGIRG